MDRQKILNGFGPASGFIRYGISGCLLCLGLILFCRNTVMAQVVCEDKTEPGSMTLSRITMQASARQSIEQTGENVLFRSFGLTVIETEQGDNTQPELAFREQGAYSNIETPAQKLKENVVPLIHTEQPGGVAERVYFHYENPDVTIRSYAAVTLADNNGNSYCSGTMIGPNVMMTAAHCGQDNTNAVFRMYTASNTQMTESFSNSLT